MIRARLKRERQLAGMTQSELAAIVGVSQQTISKHEQGKITPAHFKIIRKYEIALGVNAVELFPDVFTY